jgi:hypothetical protein
MSNIKHIEYDSIADLRAMIDQPWRLTSNQSEVREHILSTGSRPTWHGMAGGAPACIKALTEGYPDGEARIDKMREEVMARLPKAVGIGRKLVRGDQGDSLDIHAVNRGDLSRAWTSRKRLIKVGKTTLRLCCDIGGNCGVNAERMAWRGVATIALSEIMQKAGYTCEIVAAFGVKGHIERRRESNATVSVVVKSKGVSADRGLIAASLCLSGFFRNLGFDAICRAADDEGKEVAGGLGHSIQVEGVLPYPVNMTQIIVPSTIGTEDEAREWVKSTITMLQSLKGAQ